MSLNATMIGQAIAFIFFVLFCMKYIWPPLISAIEKRQKEISKTLDFVEETKKNLHLAQLDIAEKLKKAKEEAKLTIEEANKCRIKILNKAKIEAEKERIKILEKAKLEIGVERKRAYEELQEQTIELVIAGIEKIIENSIEEATRKKILDNFINRL